MKEESILSVLMYLFKYHMQDRCELDLRNEDLLPELEEAGFKRPAIIQALGWLAKLAESSVKLLEGSRQYSIRVFNDYECELMDAQCRGFIISLEQQGILNPFTRELVINQILELEHEGIDLGLIKWVTLMVLYNQPGEEEALAGMEMLVLNNEILGGKH